MITGDNGLVANSVARNLNLGKGETIDLMLDDGLWWVDSNNEKV